MLRIRKLLFPPVIFTAILTVSLIILSFNPTILRRAFRQSPVDSNFNLPGNYLIGRTPNESFCNFKYGLPDELLYEDGDLKYSPELDAKSPYRILYEVIRGEFSGIPQVTYATHVTPDFINYIAELVRIWEGPISVAAFVPDSDADLAIKQLHQLCQCAPEMSRVSLHFVFPESLPPYLQQSSGRGDATCRIADADKLSTFRAYNDLVYPINVCRNVARHSAPTSHVLVSDVQLMPSGGLASRFLAMVDAWRPNDPPSRAFVVPVFEVDSGRDVPREKRQLMRLVHEEKAVYFHRHVCSHCQKFPGIKNWLEIDPGNHIKPFISVKREFPFHRWEPVYIGTKNEPLYSEVLSWEGFQDKMTQMLEMCLIGYKFVILDGAFLVHWPGIKKKDLNSKLANYWRTPFQLENSRQYKGIVQQLLEKYDDNPKCKMQ